MSERADNLRRGRWMFWLLTKKKVGSMARRDKRDHVLLTFTRILKFRTLSLSPQIPNRVAGRHRRFIKLSFFYARDRGQMGAKLKYLAVASEAPEE